MKFSVISLVMITATASIAADGSTALKGQLEWRQVVGNTSVVSGGFGNPDNIMIRHLEPQGGDLFAVTFNEQKGAEVWKSQTGIDWTLVHQGGIGTNTATMQDLVSFEGMLYAASHPDSNCLWRSPTGTNWMSVDGPCSSPSSWNEGVLKLKVFGDHLYAGTSTFFVGCEIWRSSDGESWQPIAVGGFGNAGNSTISELEVFGGQLYAATSGSGCELWRSPDGVAWTQVLEDCFPGYFRIDAMEVFQNRFYAGAGFSGLPGFNLWSSSDGVHWTEGATEPSLLLQATDHHLFSATLVSPYQVLVSSDGSDWAPDNDSSFGNPNNYRYSGIGVFDGYLYVAARNGTEGSELWRKFVGLFADGFETGDTSGWSVTMPLETSVNN
ncbi:MAG: hypothetical protein K8R59_14275 [Thermoanaerobaculales bacterium]|nr:hypothetical protein [Thermoanaerobaculales bacterium]